MLMRALVFRLGCPYNSQLHLVWRRQQIPRPIIKLVIKVKNSTAYFWALKKYYWTKIQEVKAINILKQMFALPTSY